MKGVMRFGKKGKLSPKFIGPFEILSRVGEMAYKLAFQPSLLAVHPTFHVSMLRKYILYESHVLLLDSVDMGLDFTFEDKPIALLDRQVRKLRTKETVSVKVQRKHHSIGEATWEMESTCVLHIINFIKLQHVDEILSLMRKPGTIIKQI
ncbi:uncharacterized protein LOC125858906 [Solanum stenotomum]|uniref:uncharacterized protein LOC125858906 n=1 Tax=Solanum stenotomum TaxID=172797 RepID=UPI0020D0F8EB|nr:uncharacterized protein LOC125858906 [Solanum stenotomum]